MHENFKDALVLEDNVESFHAISLAVSAKFIFE